MSKTKNKRYVLTISKHLDKVCKEIVGGHKHFRGSRNQFFIEAIELAVVRELGQEALSEDWFSTSQSEPKEEQITPVTETEPAPPAKTESEVETPKEKEKPAEPPKKQKPGPKPKLEWRDGGIRNESNHLYELTYGPPLLSGETREQQFERCKGIKGVIFEIVSKAEVNNGLGSKLVVGNTAHL